MGEFRDAARRGLEVRRRPRSKFDRVTDRVALGSVTAGLTATLIFERWVTATIIGVMLIPCLFEEWYRTRTDRRGS